MRSRLASESLIGGLHNIDRREAEGVWEEVPIRKRGTGEGAQQGEGDVGKLVYWKVGPHFGGRTLSTPGKWHDIGGQAGAQGSIRVWCPICEQGREIWAEAGCSRTLSGGSADKP